MSIFISKVLHIIYIDYLSLSHMIGHLVWIIQSLRVNIVTEKEIYRQNLDTSNFAIHRKVHLKCWLGGGGVEVFDRLGKQFSSASNTCKTRRVVGRLVDCGSQLELV